MSALILGNEIVHYEVLGRGRPIVFLHSWAGSWRDWLQSMQTASGAYRCYALDLWGFGDTSRTPDRYTIPDQAQLVDDFMNELGIGKVALVGCGLGAVVAAHFAGEHPQFVDRLMLVGFPLSPAAVHEKISRVAPPDLSQWLLNGFQDISPFAAEAAKADPEAVRASLESLRSMDLKALLDGISLPCLLVYGEADPLISIPTFEQVAEFNERAHQVVLDNAGHLPMIVESGKFSRLIVDFLGLASGESPRSLQLKDEWKRRFR